MTFGHTITLWCSRWHEFVKLFHIVLIEDQTRNSNIRLCDQIVETLFSCYDDFPLHSEILWTFQMFQTYVSSSRYTHICSNHLWRSENNDTRREPQHSSDLIHQYVLYPISQLLAPLFLENRVSVIFAHEAWFASINWFITKWFQKSISMDFLHALYTNMT